MMYGAIIGDIAGSRFEFNNHRSKDFETFTDECFFTDDTITTIAVALALDVSKSGGYRGLDDAAKSAIRSIGRRYPGAGWGGMFYDWIFNNPEPYNSFGNGAAMRVSPVAWVAKSTKHLKLLSYKVTKISHNHPEGIKGAEATAMMIYQAIHGATMQELEQTARSYYNIDFTLDEIRDTYQFDETCQNSVPQAFRAFIESTGFEDCIHNAISIGGDSDTIAAIAGSIAEAYYGVPGELQDKALTYLTPELQDMFIRLEYNI